MILDHFGSPIISKRCILSIFHSSRNALRDFTTVSAMAHQPDFAEEAEAEKAAACAAEVEAVKATLQAAQVLLPTVKAQDAAADVDPQGVVLELENTFWTLKQNEGNSPSNKTEGGEPEEQVAVMEKHQKKVALDGKMYRLAQFVRYYNAGLPRHEALGHAAQMWNEAKRLCAYCGTWKQFGARFLTFPGLLRAMNGQLQAAARLWQQPQNRTVDLTQLPPQLRWTLFEQLPVQCDHWDLKCNQCGGLVCSHHLHTLCSRNRRNRCSLCHCTRAVRVTQTWVIQSTAGVHGMMEVQVPVALPGAR
eukprot:s1073_g4.t1